MTEPGSSQVDAESSTGPSLAADGLPVVDAMLALIEEGAEAGERQVAQAFGKHYALRLPVRSLRNRSPGSLAAEILGLFRLANSRGSEKLAIRAFTPTARADGYTTPGSVVETNCADSPFLVDSVSNALTGRGHEIVALAHPVIGVERDAAGRITGVLHASEAVRRESVMHFALAERLPAADLAGLEASVGDVVGDVQAAVGDFGAMQDGVAAMIRAARASGARYVAEEIDEAVAFLQWLLDENFVLLGYREYALAQAQVATVLGSGRGILADDAESAYAQPVAVDAISPALRARLFGDSLLVVAKTNRASTVHRQAKMDDITVLRADEHGDTTGALRLLGLFTSKAYTVPSEDVPILSRKLRQVAVAEDILEGSHDYKALAELFESFPKDELFARSAVDLRRTLAGLLDLQEHQHLQLYVHPDIAQRRVSVLVAVDRDCFSGTLRQRIERLLIERFGGSTVDYHLALGESGAARMHFAIYVDGAIPDVSVVGLQHEIAELARTWDDRLREALLARHPGNGEELARRYSALLPESYKSRTDVDAAVTDIGHFERLREGETFTIGLRNVRDDAGLTTRVGIYKTGGKARLSDFLPYLEHLGLSVVEEVPTGLTGDREGTYLHDLGVFDSAGSALDLSACGERVADALAAIWRGDTESDSLNRLVIQAGLTWQQVGVLRAYRTYRRRLGVAFGVQYENDAFAANPDIAASLVRLFRTRFDPDLEADPDGEERLRLDIEADLDRIPSLDEDRILRAYLELIVATVRTNHFMDDRSWLAIKLHSEAVPDMPRPAPLYEIFVYSPRMEGIHLRGGLVARGGIRASDRQQDYRIEILGLMKAQMVKNAVIVPVGSKGGFVLRRPPTDRDALLAEVEAQYVTFVRGLLDLTDNRVGGEIVHPERARIHDGPDPYLVVAADKGTATFSDVANEVAAEYGFWLGDAFASGGSHGYDHKELGITARGAWESVRRHFRELQLDPEREDITVVGIGDMSGDVFGNGMLLSEHIKLVAAFDHRHVFLDPDPDPALALAERRRLFALERSGWDDYDPGLISSGGGVFSRQLKSVPLSVEAREALGVDVERLTPGELISAVLRAPVDLLWNGGVGTFVKASSERNALVGDRTNDAVRVDAAEVRARVVVEGGNLGLTQKARIEYARGGGLCYIDAIDNSAGVDLSDHEVNLKILLGLAVDAGELSPAERDALLDEVEDGVAEHVLYHNYLQAQMIAQEVPVSGRLNAAYEDLMAALEDDGILDRALETLPSTDEMAERGRAGTPMTRPELSVLLAFAKRSLEEQLRGSSLLDNDCLSPRLTAYFPPAVIQRYGHHLAHHPLRGDLLATIIANEVVNAQGITFVSRLARETGARLDQVTRAYLIARDSTGATDRWGAVEALDGQIDVVLQNELMVSVDTLVGQLARWYVLNDPEAPLGATIAKLTPAVDELEAALADRATEVWRRNGEPEVDRLTDQGLARDLAVRHAVQPELRNAANALAIATRTGRGVREVASALLAVGEEIHLDSLEARLESVRTANRHERWAKRAMRDELLELRGALALAALVTSETLDPAHAVAEFVATRHDEMARLQSLVAALAAEGEASLAELTVATRSVRGLLR